MIEAVAFDLDGTLIDSTDAIVDSFLHAFSLSGARNPSRDEIVASISVVLEQQLEILGHPDPHAGAAVYREHYNREASAKTTLLPGARSALERLTAIGLPLGIATSKRRASAEPLLEHLDVLHFFGSCIGPEDVEFPKPHPEPLLAVAENLGVESAKMVYVGDSVYDIRAAHAADMRCLCVTTGYSTQEALVALNPAGLFESLEEVADFVLSETETAK